MLANTDFYETIAAESAAIQKQLNRTMSLPTVTHDVVALDNTGFIDTMTINDDKYIIYCQDGTSKAEVLFHCDTDGSLTPVIYRLGSGHCLKLKDELTDNDIAVLYNCYGISIQATAYLEKAVSPFIMATVQKSERALESLYA